MVYQRLGLVAVAPAPAGPMGAGMRRGPSGSAGNRIEPEQVKDRESGLRVEPVAPGRVPVPPVGRAERERERPVRRALVRGRSRVRGRRSDDRREVGPDPAAARPESA
jgi:hypothetical protein